MKIIKTENTSKSMEVFKNGIGKIGDALKGNIKRNLIIFGALVLVCGAVALNIMLFADADKGDSDNYDPSFYNSGETGTNGADENDESSYFAMAQIDRAQARDEALEVLYTITASAEATEEAKSNAYSGIEKLARVIETEANIETLIKSKGISECVAVISDDKADIIVSGDGLLPTELAQITEIVYEQASIAPMNIKIIEKSA